MWVYPPNCRIKVGARWSPSFPRQSLARRRARNIVQVHAHALNGSWECYHVVRIGLGVIWGDHGRRRSLLHFTTPHFLSEKGVGIPTFCPFPFIFFVLFPVRSRCCVFFFLPSNHFARQNLFRTHVLGSARQIQLTDRKKSLPKQLLESVHFDRFCRVQNLPTSSVELIRPITELYFQHILSTDFMNRLCQDVKTGPQACGTYRSAILGEESRQ